MLDLQLIVAEPVFTAVTTPFFEILATLLKDAEVLFCDEPTGALDTKSTADVLHVLQMVQKRKNTTIVLITHNELIRKIADKILFILKCLCKKEMIG